MWIDVERDIAKFVSKCTTRQMEKVDYRQPTGVLQQLDILVREWECILVDLIWSYQFSRGVKIFSRLFGSVDQGGAILTNLGGLHDCVVMPHFSLQKESEPAWGVSQHCFGSRDKVAFEHGLSPPDQWADENNESNVRGYTEDVYPGFEGKLEAIFPFGRVFI